MLLIGSLGEELEPCKAATVISLVNSKALDKNITSLLDKVYFM
jgi:hypothetical protein